LVTTGDGGAFVTRRNIWWTCAIVAVCAFGAPVLVNGLAHGANADLTPVAGQAAVAATAPGG